MSMKKHLFFFAPEGEGGGEHTHETAPQTPPVVAPVIDTGNELVAPVVDHTEKITRIEERQAQMQEERFREMRELEERLQSASASQVQGIMERIAALEAKIEAASASAEAEPEGAGVELELPDVETSPAPPEKVRQGLRHRRKARRKGKQ